MNISTFFIVEDEPMLHKLYRNILEMRGHRVIGDAYNGKECVEKLNHNGTYPDFVIMDHRMPIKNGLEATKELLDINPELKIIFISGDLTIQKQALSIGAVTFIQKPFDINTLYNKLDELVNQT